jgi:hypothetical protein
VVAQSTCETEYYGAGSATKEALWLRKSLKDFGLPVPVLPIFTDNQASLSLLKHGAVSPATKHIDVIYHAVRDFVLRGDIIFYYISTEKMVADFLTKALPLPKFQYYLGEIGMHPTVYAAAKSLSPCSGFGLERKRKDIYTKITEGISVAHLSTLT